MRDECTRELINVFNQRIHDPGLIALIASRR